MHPITIEYLAHDHIADLRRDAMQPHVPEVAANAGRRSRARLWIGAGFVAIARRVRGARRVRPVRRPNPSPAR